MKQQSPYPRASIRIARLLCTFFLLACGLHFAGYSQTTFFTYGKPGQNDGGTVIVPPNSALPVGHFLIAGYTQGPAGDSTFIMEIDAAGTIFNQVVFKLSPVLASDRLTDLRFDTNGNLIGCGFNFGTGVPDEHNGWYFKMPASLVGFIWQFSIGNITAPEAYQPFCIHELLGGGNYILSGKRWSPGGFPQSEDPWAATIDRATGIMLPAQTWLNLTPNQADGFTNMLELGGSLYGLGDADHATAPTGFLRPSLTQMNLALGFTAALSYMEPFTTANVRGTDHVGFNNIYYNTGYGDYKPGNLISDNTLILWRTIGGLPLDPGVPVTSNMISLLRKMSDPKKCYY